MAETLLETAQTGGLPFPDVLRGLEAVVVAIISAEGILLDANRGFLLLMTRNLFAPEVGDVRDLFVSPRFDELTLMRARPLQDSVFRGLLSFGQAGGRVTSLRGAIYAHDEDYLLIAEHDIVRLETLRATLLELQDDLAEKQRHIIHIEHRAAKLQELADAAMRDRDTLLDALARRGGLPNTD
ncbi:MAG: hypothetical protein IPK66_03230 [Rhodospirillales bacterium]|nr:hypothetical protein [Rhodospirillales bacterium]